MNCEGESLSLTQGPQLIYCWRLSALTEFESTCYSLLIGGSGKNQHQQMTTRMFVIQYSFSLFLICGEGEEPSVGIFYISNRHTESEEEKKKKLSDYTSWHFDTEYFIDILVSPSHFKSSIEVFYPVTTKKKTEQEWGLESDGLELKYCFWLWANHWNFVSLGFLIFKIKINANTFLFQLLWDWMIWIREPDYISQRHGIWLFFYVPNGWQRVDIYKHLMNEWTKWHSKALVGTGLAQ